MRFAAAASFALVLLAGNTGCCLFCRPLFPCLHRHYHEDDCCGMGCQRQPIFNWGHCCDPCDHCGDWAGQSIIARTGNTRDGVYQAENRQQGKAKMASRIVPGSYREVTRVQEAGEEDELVEEEVEDEPEVVAQATRAKRVRSLKPRSRQQGEIVEETVVEEEPEVVAQAPRAKRIRSTKPRSREQVVRVQRVE